LRPPTPLSYQKKIIFSYPEKKSKHETIFFQGDEIHSQPLAASPAHGVDEARMSSVKVAVLKFKLVQVYLHTHMLLTFEIVEHTKLRFNVGKNVHVGLKADGHG
jgi:hypothetical protein